MVRVAEIVPNLVEAIALLFLIPLIWLFISISFTTNKSAWIQKAAASFPTYCFYLFPQIYYTHVRSRERKEEEMMLAHGLKKASYWFVSTALDILLLIVQYAILLLLQYVDKATTLPTN